MSGLDRHVILATTHGTFTPSGRRLTGPVDSIDKLRTLIGWARGQGLLTPPGARVWIVGSAWRGLAGHFPDAAGVDTVAAVGQGLGVLAAQGWELRGDGTGSFTLTDPAATSGGPVEVLVEPEPWLAGGDPAVAADPAELGRRLTVWAGALGELPAADPVQSGAVLLDAILAARSGRRGAVSITAGVLPVGVDVDTTIQPEWTAGADQAEVGFTHAEDLVLLRQEAGMLASAGMAMLGHGAARTVAGPAAAQAAADPKPPFGLWRATLPPLDGLGLPEQLPAPHPRMRHSDATPGVWLTTEDLALLGRDPRDGGAGLTIDALQIDAAVIWPQQGRLLESWTTRLRQAREHLAADPVMAGLIEHAAASYLTGMADPDLWDDPARRHHFQPAWAATLVARTRARTLRAAARISREYRVWPLWAAGTELIYAVDADPATGRPVDLADTTTNLGRLVTAARAPISNDTILDVLLADTPDQIADALTTPLDAATPTLALRPAQNASDTTTQNTADTATRNIVDTALQETSYTAGLKNANTAPQKKGDTENRKTANTEKRKRGAGSQGVAAAVLHTDGVWLPDGTRLDVDGPIVHAGQIAELAARLAQTHQLGYRLSPTYVDTPQIWITDEVCLSVGIDVEQVQKYKADDSLREITAGLDFVTLATAEGWRFGGVQDGETPGLGAWTRVYRGEAKKDKQEVLLALIPALGIKDERDMPVIFIGEQTPQALVRRLQRFADAMRMPWKFGAGTVGRGMILDSRPRTYTFDEWRGRVFAPSETPPPYGIEDVEEDYSWTRPPDEAEQRCRFIHAYDRGASYFAAIPGLELPIGEPIHHDGPIPFDPKTPGYWRIEVPEPDEWRMPYVLNPRGLKFHEPKWVTTPRLERALALGYEPKILEAVVWPEHGRVLNGWYEQVRAADAAMDVSDPEQKSVREQIKVVRTHVVGLMGSEIYWKGATGYSPERRYHIMAKANANIVYAINDIGRTTGRWPVAVDTDTVFYVSDNPDPKAAWPGDPTKWGTGFGQYKWAGSALLADYLASGGGNLTDDADEWAALITDRTTDGGQ